MTVNQQILQGNWNEIKGKLRSRWGDISGDELDRAHGDVEQLVGNIQRQTGEARESIQEYLEELTSDEGSHESLASKAAGTVRQYTEGAKRSVQESARYATEAVRSGYEKTEHTLQKRPVESLAVCFGAGLITGVVVGLLIRSR